MLTYGDASGDLPCPAPGVQLLGTESGPSMTGVKQPSGCAQYCVYSDTCSFWTYDKIAQNCKQYDNKEHFQGNANSCSGDKSCIDDALINAC